MESIIVRLKENYKRGSCSMPIITFSEVSKEYASKTGVVHAVTDISFEIEEGEIIGLVGPNGAGKSTTVKMLCGILKPSNGRISVLGYTPHSDRKKLAMDIGVMFGNRSSLWYNIPAIESIKLMRDLYGISKKNFEERIQEYCEILGANELLDKPVRHMSLGQRIKIELLVTLIHNPKLLILDEPTLGLDIVTKGQFREVLVKLSKNKKTTVVITTHDLSDVEKICDRVVLINHGKKLMDTTNKEFNHMMAQYDVIYLNNISTSTLSDSLRDNSFFREKIADDYKFIVPKQAKNEFLNRVLCDSQLTIRTEKPSLEDLLYEYYS